MWYWAVVFLILTSGFAILAFDPVGGPLLWAARMAVTAFSLAFLFSLAYACRGKSLRAWLRHERGQRSSASSR